LEKIKIWACLALSVLAFLLVLVNTQGDQGFGEKLIVSAIVGVVVFVGSL
jgi:hypothetical protein